MLTLGRVLTPRKSYQTYFSITIKGFLHCSVYFSETFKKSKQKKSQTNNFYVQIRPSTEFGPPPSFFYFFKCFTTPTTVGEPKMKQSPSRHLCSNAAQNT